MHDRAPRPLSPEVRARVLAIVSRHIGRPVASLTDDTELGDDLVAVLMDLEHEMALDEESVHGAAEDVRVLHELLEWLELELGADVAEEEATLLATATTAHHARRRGEPVPQPSMWDRPLPRDPDAFAEQEPELLRELARELRGHGPAGIELRIGRGGQVDVTVGALAAQVRAIEDLALAWPDEPDWRPVGLDRFELMLCAYLLAAIRAVAPARSVRKPGGTIVLLGAYVSGKGVIDLSSVVAALTRGRQRSLSACVARIAGW